DADRAVNSLRFGRIQLGRVEPARITDAVIDGLKPGEADTKVERQPRQDLPCILQEPGKVVIEGVLIALDARLRVAGINTQQGVRERVSGVERIRRVGAEIDIALDVVLRVAGVRGALEVKARLKNMVPADLGDVVHGLPDQEALVESSEDAGVGDARDGRGTDAADATEGEARNQVRSVGV